MKKRGFEVVKESMRQTKGEVILPTRATKNSAGHDFYAPCDIVIAPYSSTSIIPTDVKAYMANDEVLLLFVRSSIGMKKGLNLANNVAVIDADYYSNPDNDGNIGFALRNLTDNVVAIKKGERIIQGVFIKYLTADDGNTEEERVGGIGSTGVK